MNDQPNRLADRRCLTSLAPGTNQIMDHRALPARSRQRNQCTAVVTRPMRGARPFGASLTLFIIVADDFVAAVRLALPALAIFLKRLLRSEALVGSSQASLHCTVFIFD
ncbi:MAG: hypothetical protein ACFCVA_02735 [Gammaproteobacteria bacterium]